MPGAAASGGCRTSPRCRGAGKLGADPVRMLFEHVAEPTGAVGAPGVFCCGLRVVSMDGSVTDVPDSDKNAAFFAVPATSPGTARSRRPGGSRWPSRGPGSLLGAAIGRYTDAEQPLAADLLGCFGPGMPVLADRKFFSWSAARAFLATGAHILWRASASFTLKPVQVLLDGTSLAELKPPRKSDGPPVMVRVIEYTVHATAEDGTGESSEVFCLVTDLAPQPGPGSGQRGPAVAVPPPSWPAGAPRGPRLAFPLDRTAALVAGMVNSAPAAAAPGLDQLGRGRLWPAPLHPYLTNYR